MNPTLKSVLLASTVALSLGCRVQSEIGDLGQVVMVRSEHAVDVLFDGEVYAEECVPVQCLMFFPNS